MHEVLANSIFLASAFTGLAASPPLAVSSSDRQCTIIVLNIAELTKGTDEAEFSNQISAVAGIWTRDLLLDSPAKLTATLLSTLCTECYFNTAATIYLDRSPYTENEGA